MEEIPKRTMMGMMKGMMKGDDGGDNELRLLFSNYDRRTPRKTIILKAEQKKRIEVSLLIL